jgi:hypothetical protein
MNKTTSGVVLLSGLFIAVCSAPLTGASSGLLCVFGVTGGLIGVGMFFTGAMWFSRR